MSTALIVIGVVLFMAVAKIVIIVAIRNGIVETKNRVKRAWADVIAYERKKLQVIPALEQGLQNYQIYERGVQREVTELRAAVGALSTDKLNCGQLREVEALSQAVMNGLRVTVEAYPELKTSELYAGWMRELAESEENIAAAIVIFNETVNRFNDGIQTFPNNLINAMFNREKSLDTFSDSQAQAEFEYQPKFSNE